MIKEELLTLDSPNRESLKVYGYRFGKKGAKPSMAIVAGFSGNHIDQVHTAGGLVNFLKRKCAERDNFVLGEVLVIPAVNLFALNMAEKFWPLDKTDIDVMFPGYEHGETTQRIAHRLFEKLQGFDYGLVLEGRKDMAVCLPYLKLLKSGYESVDTAKTYGLPFIHHRTASPMETATLAYNWAVWGTQACSIVWGADGQLNHAASENVKECVIRFLSKNGIIDHPAFDGYCSNVVTREQIEVVKSPSAGIFLPYVKPFDSVHEGQFLGLVKDALEGDITAKLYAPCDGVVSCLYGYSLIFENSIAARVIKRVAGV